MEKPYDRDKVVSAGHTSPGGYAFLVKKGEAVPANAVPLHDSDVIELQLKRIENFKPQSEMRAFTWGVGSLSSTVAISSVIINNIVRRNFKLGGLGKMRTYIPVVGIPTMLSLLLQEVVIKRDILLGKENCPLCVSLRSGACQFGVGVAYPYVVSILSCLPIAREYYTLSLPEKVIGGSGSIFRLLRQVSPSATVLTFLGITHMVMGMKIASKEMKLFHQHLNHPPSFHEMPIDMPDSSDRKLD